MTPSWTKLFCAFWMTLLPPAAALGGEESAGPPTNWPQFRGPQARGAADGVGLPDQWSATKNVAWKTDLPGRGWSSPIVWGDSVFLTTAVNLGKSETPKKGLYLGGNRLEPPKSVHEWKVYCLDLATGAIRWERMVHRGEPAGAIHLKNSLASETSVTDGERVYAYFGNLGVYCLDFQGKILWSKRIEPHKTRDGWGTAASPVLHGNRLYLVNDNEEQSYLLALDKQSGAEAWRVPRSEKSNWSTPYVWENGRRTEIVTAGTGQVRSYDLDGKLLWSLAGMSSITIPTPHAADGLLYVSSGFIISRARPLYAIRPGASGDISLESGKNDNASIAWCNRTAGPYNPSTLHYRDRIYVLYDRGTLACFDAKTGKAVYAQQRLPEGRAFTASPWACDGKVFCLNEDGATFVVRAGDKFEVLQTNKLADDDMGMATPAVVRGRLLIRTSARLYGIGGPK
jgi:outer membrane protein assembly factor BamB